MLSYFWILEGRTIIWAKARNRGGNNGFQMSHQNWKSVIPVSGKY